MTVRLRLASLALAAGCLAALAPPAFAGKQAPAPTLTDGYFILPPGGQLSFDELKFNTCHGVDVGYDVVYPAGGGYAEWLLRPDGSCTGGTPGVPTIVNTTGSDLQVAVWLKDYDCGSTYYYSGSDHWAMLKGGRIALNDGGDNCKNSTSASIPRSKQASFSARVSMTTP